MSKDKRDRKRNIEKREVLRERPKAKIWVSLVCIFLITISVFLVYANTLKNDFIWDDEFLVRDNLFIRSFTHLKELFTSHLASSSPNVNNFYRPIQDLSYMVDYFLWAYEPMGFHLTNIILHALCAVFVYVLILKIFANYKVALLTAMLFGVHPINTQAITYVAGRADPLYLFFFLLAFISFLKVISKLETDNKIPIYFFVISLACYAISILSKEIGIILPIFLFLYHKAFLEKTRIEIKARRLYPPYFIIAGIYIFLRKTVLDFSTLSPSTLMARFNLYDRLVTFFKVIVEYLRLLILPLGLRMERTIKVAHSMFEPEALLAAVIIALIFFGIFKAYKGRRRKVFFVSLWFFAGLITVSNIVPINSFIAEHWLYLPAIGIFALAGMGIVKLSSLIKPRTLKVVPIAASIMLLLFYSHLTIERNKDWKDEVTFFKSTLKYSPNNSRLHLNLGNTYSEQGMNQKALEEYKKAAELLPGDPIAYGNMGSIYMGMRQYDKAESFLKKALNIKPDFADVIFNLARLYEDKGDYTLALEQYKKAVRIRPNFLEAHMNLGSLYLRKNEIEKSLYHWKEALRINPHHKKADQLLKRYSQ